MTTQKKRGPGAPARYDWKKWRRAYMVGDDTVSLEVLSNRPGAPSITQLKRRCRAEDWTDLRQEFRVQTEPAKTDHMKELVAEVRDHHVRAGRQFLGLALKSLAQLDPADLKPSDVAAFARVAGELQRRALGIEDVGISWRGIRSPEDLKGKTAEELLAMYQELPE